ncbi:hypothetical protein NQZ68_025762, partial [Dissostichus eleginoides]
TAEKGEKHTEIESVEQIVKEIKGQTETPDGYMQASDAARWLPLPTLPKEQKERLYVSVRELASCSSDSQAARECVHGKEMRKRLSNITVK